MAESVIRISGVHPTLDGDYPIDLGGFSNRDFHDVKRIAGVRSQEMTEAFTKGDTDMFVAFAVIALRNAGKHISEDVLWDAPVASLVLVVGDEEEDEVKDLPPISAPPSVTGNELGGGVERSAESETSGSASSSDAVPLVSGQNGTGTPHSVIGARSPLEMSAT